MQNTKQKHPLLQKFLVGIKRVKLTYNNTVAKATLPKDFMQTEMIKKLKPTHLDISFYFENGQPLFEVKLVRLENQNSGSSKN